MAAKGKGKLWKMARIYTEMRDRVGPEEAALYARANIPQQLQYQIGLLIREIDSEKILKNS